MSFTEESSVEIYCGLCNRILNPPFEESKIYVLDGDAPVHPVCSTCLSFLEKVNQIVENHSIKWAELTPTGEKWMKTSGAKAYMDNNEGDISFYAKLPVSASDEEVIFKDIMMGRTDPDVFEWEYHELIKRVMKPSYRDDLSKVLKAYCARNPNIGYCQGMSYVCMWLLLFLDCNSAFWTLCYLVEKWLLPDFYIGSKHGNPLNGFYIESTTISGLLEKCLPFITSGCLPADQFSDFFSLQLLIQLFVNTVDLESCIFLWNKLMEDGSIALIRGVVSLISISERPIRDGEHPLNILKTFPGNRIKPQLSEEYNKLKSQVTEKRVQGLRHQAREYRAREWQKCEKFALKRLEKAAGLNEKEINDLKNIFLGLIQKNEENLERQYTTKIHNYDKGSFNKDDYQSGIRKDQFVELITTISPNLRRTAELMFDLYDEDKSGLLDFRELTICLSTMCKGDFDDKLRVCFDAYDRDKSGFLQPSEMNELIESLTRPYRVQKGQIPVVAFNSDEIKTRMNIICQKSGDILCFKDFLNAVKADPTLYACFCSHFGTMKSSSTEISSLSKKISKRDEESPNRCAKCLIH